MLHRVDLVRIDVSEELSASFIRLATIGELGNSIVKFIRYTMQPSNVEFRKQ
jgi:hypothetical protein